MPDSRKAFALIWIDLLAYVIVKIFESAWSDRTYIFFMHLYLYGLI